MFLFRAHSRSDPDAERRLADRLKGHVEILAGLIGPRHLGKPSSLEAAAAYVERQFAEMGDAVVRQSYSIGSSTVANLVIERRGSRRAGEIVILGAHYDTVSSTPGADDNASAVAVLIESARLLKGIASQRTLRFVAFTCEEPPYFYTGSMGSQHHAHTCRKNNEQIVGMLCLEMVGYYASEPGSQQVPDAIPKLLRRIVPRQGDFLAAVGNIRSLRLLGSFRRGFKRGSTLPLFPIALPESISEIRLSDNAPFWDEGYPALMITDTSFLRNPHYHQPSDTPDTLDYPRMAKATLGVASAMTCIGKASAWPDASSP